MIKHWSRVEYLHETVTNPDINIRGTHSYCSDAWSGGFPHSALKCFDSFRPCAW